MNPNRKLLQIPELAKKYNATTINVAYVPKHFDAEPNQTDPNTKLAYYTLPVCLDVLIKNKVWLAYDAEKDTIVTPKTLIGVGNHWLNTFRDDHKNRRIDVNHYTIG